MSDLVARALALYAGCASYSDIGEASVVIARGPKAWQRTTQRFPFQTAFVRPARFLFEWKTMGVGPNEQWPHAALWRNARGVFEWQTDPEVRECAVRPIGSLAAPLQAWSSSCAGASVLVPGLLGLCEMSSSLDGLQLAGEDEVDGRRAHRLEKSLVGGVFVAWIGVERPLLLRTFQRLRHSPERDATLRQLAERAELPAEVREAVLATPSVDSERIVETTIFLRPELDPALSDAVFEPQPPR